MSDDNAATAARLREDLGTMKRYGEMMLDIHNKTIKACEDEIARLEAEADPWRRHHEAFEVKRSECMEGSFGMLLVELYDHLTAEVADLKHKYDLANSTIKIATERLNETTAENADLKKENAALGKRLEDVNRELAKAQDDNRDLLEEIQERAKERDEALERVEELENEPRLATLVLRRADEIKLGDTIVSRGKVCTVSEIAKNFMNSDMACVTIHCKDWRDRTRPEHLYTVVNPVPPPESPPADDEPVLDPARVLRTAGDYIQSVEMPNMSVEMMKISLLAGDAKPYKLKGGENGG